MMAISKWQMASTLYIADHTEHQSNMKGKLPLFSIEVLSPSNSVRITYYKGSHHNMNIGKHTANQ